MTTENRIDGRAALARDSASLRAEFQRLERRLDARIPGERPLAEVPANPAEAATGDRNTVAQDRG